MAALIVAFAWQILNCSFFILSSSSLVIHLAYTSWRAAGPCENWREPFSWWYVMGLSEFPETVPIILHHNIGDGSLCVENLWSAAASFPSFAFLLIFYLCVLFKAWSLYTFLSASWNFFNFFWLWRAISWKRSGGELEGVRRKRLTVDWVWNKSFWK